MTDKANKTVVIVGALSIGEGIKELLATEFPAEFTITNFCPFGISLSEIGLHALAGKASSITVRNADSLLRAANSASQIAYLNNVDQLLSIQAGAPEVLAPAGDQEQVEAEQEPALGEPQEQVEAEKSSSTDKDTAKSQPEGKKAKGKK